MSKQSKSNLSFEDAFSQLEDIVGKLESGSLSLDESLALFEQGQHLATVCNTKLDEAELKIQQLTSSPQGEISLSPLIEEND